MSSALLPFRYPMRLGTLILGGMLTSMCTWSGIRCPSIVSAPFLWQRLLRVSPRPLRHRLQMAFLPCLGQDTMWYLHIHFVCARLFAFCAMVFSFLSRPAT